MRMISAVRSVIVQQSARLLTVYVLVAIIGLAAAKECIPMYDDNSFDTNIQSNIDGGVTTLVMFYAPWCGHCKKLKPEIEKACDDLKAENARHIAIAKVDCTADDAKKTCDFYGISGYPTLKIFKKSLEKPDEYNGERNADGIKKRMKKMASESVQNAKTKEDMEKIRETTPESLIVGVFESEASGSALYKEFANVAEAQRDHYTFVKTSKDVVTAFDVKLNDKSENVLIMYPKKMHSKFEPDYLVYDSAAHKDLTKFVKQHVHGLCGHRTKDNANDFGYPHIVAYYDVDYVKNPKGTNYWRNRIFKAVKDYFQNKNAKYAYKVAISSKDDFGHELNEFNLNGPETMKAPIVVVRTKVGSTFLLNEFSIAALKSFLNDIDNDKIEPYLKSEPIPEKQGSLLVAVAKNFEDIVFKSGKDSLIKFYAPWCGHCKKLAPVFDELAEKLKDEDVNIVKFDATANYVDPRFQVRGYPTLIWVSKSGEIKPYEGDRELNDFVKFIAKEATDELKYYDRKGNAKKNEL